MTVFALTERTPYFCAAAIGRKLNLVLKPAQNLRSAAAHSKLNERIESSDSNTLRVFCRMKLRLRLSTALMLVLWAAPAALAETGEPGITNFTAAFFSQLQPVNAAEMVRQVPGFQIRNGDLGVRGYSGSAGNILIDGQRPTSKEESPEALLERIPAEAVDHIELVRSGAEGFDMQGYALLVNVVRSTKVSLRGRVEVQNAHSHSGYSAPRAEAQINWLGDTSSVNLSTTLYQAIDNGLGYGRRDQIAEDGTPIKLAQYAYPRLGEGGQASIEYRQELPAGSLTLNGVGKQSFWHADINEIVSHPAPLVQPAKDRERRRTAEAQARYETDLSDNETLQILASHRSNEKLSRSASFSPGSVSLSTTRAGSRESILHADYRRQDGDVSLNAGVEGSINILNSRNGLETNGVPVALPSANVRVEEQRGEGFLVGTWRATPTITAEAEMRYETSVLSQSGDANLTKPLSYAKPRIQASWRPIPGNELRFSVERQVGQLNFDDFVSSANLLNNNVEAGNRDLEPDRKVRFELTWERRFWKRGSLTLTAQRDDVTALIDHVPIIGSNGSVLDANGNIGNGQRDRLRANLTMPLDPLCLGGFTVRAAGTLNHSEVVDPATGQMRPFSGQQPFDGWVSVTQDMPKQRLRWGMTMASQSNYRTFKANEFERSRYPARLSAFVEYRPKPQWTVRLFGERLTQVPSVRERTIYSGLRGASTVAYVEQRALNTGMMLGVNIQHTFEE